MHTYPKSAFLLLLSAGVLATAPTSAGGNAPPDPQPASRSPRHISLLIGIGDYQHFFLPGTPGRSDLEGPPNDLQRIAKSLERKGFDERENTRLLLNSQASRTGIAEAFAWLASRATDTADVVVVYYSGHGSHVPDIDGDEARLTPGDREDEALVPWDASAVDQPGELVLDDQIGEWLDRLGTSNVTVIVDACFSGTVTRGDPGATAPRPRGLPGNTAAVGQANPFERWDNPKHTLITASAPGELSYEKGFAPERMTFGVFTYHLTRALDGAGPATRFDELLAQVRSQMGEAQTPQLEGDRTARLFKVHKPVAERAFALVTPSADGTFMLDVGAVHGVRASAAYDVYGPSEMRFTGAPIARLRVDSVGELTSVAHTVQGRLSGRARAVLARVPQEAMTLDRLPVYLHPSAAAARDAVGALDWIRLTSAGEAMAEVRNRGGVFQVLVRGDSLPPLAEDSAAGYERRQSTPVGVLVGYEGTAQALCGPLRRAFSVATLELVRNPNPPPLLDVHIRVVPSGTSPEERSGGADTVRVGEPADVFVRIDASNSSTLYASVAVTGYSADPVVIEPTGAGPNQPFPLNQWKRVVRGARISEPSGIEVIKAVVNSEQFDLRPLVASFPKCGPAGVRGRNDPSPWTSDTSPVTGWTSAERRVVILSPSA